MITQNKYRILIWIIVVLLATNLSMGLSFYYHKHQENKIAEKIEKYEVEIPAQRRTRFFREQLHLRPEQMKIFRDLNRTFNRSAWQITHQLENYRIEMVEEMGKKKPDTSKLNSISDKIGELHTQLKKLTIDYYLGMKAECNSEQQKKLNELFMSVLKNNEDVRLPEQGRRNFNRN